MNKYTELSLYLKLFRNAASVKVDDKIALASILNRLDNLEDFIEYLREEQRAVSQRGESAKALRSVEGVDCGGKI